VTGPLHAGTWKATRFAVPFTFRVPAYAWVGELPSSDNVSIVAAADDETSLTVLAPKTVYLTPTKLERAGSPAHLLRLLRANMHLTLGHPHSTSVDGHPGIELSIGVHNAPQNFGACGPTPCVAVFTIAGGNIDLHEGTAGTAILLTVRGHTLMILSGAKTGDARGLAQIAARVRTFHFTAA
jgi:hypothetical protein